MNDLEKLKKMRDEYKEKLNLFLLKIRDKLHIDEDDPDKIAWMIEEDQTIILTFKGKLEYEYLLDMIQLLDLAEEEIERGFEQYSRYSMISPDIRRRRKEEIRQAQEVINMIDKIDVALKNIKNNYLKE